MHTSATNSVYLYVIYGVRYGDVHSAEICIRKDVDVNNIVITKFQQGYQNKSRTLANKLPIYVNWKQISKNGDRNRFIRN